jgi:hypothetical protein
MAQVTGRIYIKVNGRLLRTKEGAKLNNFGGIERTPVVGNVVHGYTEKVVAPSVECTLADTADLKLRDIHNTTNTEVTLETDTGKTYILLEAWCESAISLTGGEGDVECKFTGVAWEEKA